jgi:hypothetical protein
LVENVFYLNANESKGALIIDELSSKVGEIAADSLAADLIAFELKHGPRFEKRPIKIYMYILRFCSFTHIIIAFKVNSAKANKNV